MLCALCALKFRFSKSKSLKESDSTPRSASNCLNELKQFFNQKITLQKRSEFLLSGKDFFWENVGLLFHQKVLLKSDILLKSKVWFRWNFKISFDEKPSVIWHLRYFCLKRFVNVHVIIFLPPSPCVVCWQINRYEARLFVHNLSNTPKHFYIVIICNLEADIIGIWLRSLFTLCLWLSSFGFPKLLIRLVTLQIDIKRILLPVKS